MQHQKPIPTALCRIAQQGHLKLWKPPKSVLNNKGMTLSRLRCKCKCEEYNKTKQIRSARKKNQQNINFFSHSADFTRLYCSRRCVVEELTPTFLYLRVNISMYVCMFKWCEYFHFVQYINKCFCCAFILFAANLVGFAAVSALNCPLRC